MEVVILFYDFAYEKDGCHMNQISQAGEHHQIINVREESQVSASFPTVFCPLMQTNFQRSRPNNNTLVMWHSPTAMRIDYITRQISSATFLGRHRVQLQFSLLTRDVLWNIGWINIDFEWKFVQHGHWTLIKLSRTHLWCDVNALSLSLFPSSPHFPSFSSFRLLICRRSQPCNELLCPQAIHIWIG